MFTGIVEEIGKVKSIKKGTNSAILEIEARLVLEGTKLGDSIAVNGICLTVTDLTANSFRADVMHETLNRSALKSAKAGMKVNLERAMLAGGRFGGHIVSGHVDGLGKIKSIKKDDNAILYRIEAEGKILKYIVEKGSITIDGISLTVADVTGRDFMISAIPHTVAQTILSEKKVGDYVNLENDIIGKYVEKLMMPEGQNKQENTSKISKEFLLANGF
ncbi:MAG: riboflavin synthase [Lachnospiraceae bacterium]|nr:riboflavin synthase [Lachnospiraceae bacterium]